MRESADVSPSDVVSSDSTGLNAQPRCFIVKVGTSDTAGPKTIGCRHLSDKVLRELGVDVAVWGDNRRIVYRVHEVMRKHGLPPLAVVLEKDPDYVLSVPPPIGVPFEPMPVDETHPGLIDLISVGDSTKPTAPGERLRSPFWRRSLVQAGLPLTVALALMIQLLNMWHGFARNSWLKVVGAAIVALTFVLLIAGSFRRTEWLLVPGAIIQRSPNRLRGSARLLRFTPTLHTLIVRAVSPAWRAEIWDEVSLCTSQLVTKAEALALLAAWQSPLRTPTLEEMSDLH